MRSVLATRRASHGIEALPLCLRTRVKRPTRNRMVQHMKEVETVSGPELKTRLRLAGVAQTDANSFAGYRDRVLLLFLYDTGLRLSEALSVRVGEELLTEGALTIVGKGNKARRDWTGLDGA